MKLRILLGVLSLGVAGPAMAEIPNPPPMNNQPVIDAANIIPQDREDALKRRLFEIKEKSGHEIAVVTVPDMGGYDIEEYSNNAANFYGLGTKDGDDGILFLIAPNQRRDRIEVGSGLEVMVPDGVASKINDSMVVPMFKAGDFPGGIELGVEELAKIIVPMSPEQLAIKQREEAAAAARSAAALAMLGDIILSIVAFIAFAAGGFGLFKLVTLPKRRRLEREAEAARQAAYEERQRLKAARDAQLAKDRAEQLERDRLQAIENARLEDERREREAEAARQLAKARAAKLEADRLAREKMLAAMTPKEVEAFFKKERDDAEAARQAEAERERLAKIERARLKAIADAKAAERAREEARLEEQRRAQRRRDEEEAAARRRRDSGYSSSSSSSYGSSSSSYGSSTSSSSDYGGGGGSFSGGGDSGSW